jgi:hypothetical protein
MSAEENRLPGSPAVPSYNWDALTRIRHLPGWPPAWSGGRGLVPRSLSGVLRTVHWRIDLRGRADLRITVEYAGDLWAGVYPDDQQVRAKVGEERLQRLHRILTHYIGQDMAYVGELDVG